MIKELNKIKAAPHTLQAGMDSPACFPQDVKDVQKSQKDIRISMNVDMQAEGYNKSAYTTGKYNIPSGSGATNITLATKRPEKI